MSKETNRQENKNARGGALLKIDTIGLALLILFACSRINLKALGKDTLATDGFVTRQAFVALSDVWLVLTFGWFVLRTNQMRAWRRLWWPPVPCWAVGVAMILAALHSPTVVNALTENGLGPKSLLQGLKQEAPKQAIIDTVQFVAYFLIGPMVFVNLIHDRRSGELIDRRRMALHAFSGAVLLVALGGFVELLIGREKQNPPYALWGGPNALFSTPNAYAAFLAITLPFAVAHILTTWNKPLPPFITTMLALVFGLATLISPWATLAIFAGVAVAGVLTRQTTRAAIVLGIMTVVGLGTWFGPGPLQAQHAFYLSRRDEPELPHHEGEKSTSEEASAPSATPGKPEVKKQFIEWGAALKWGQSLKVPSQDEESTERWKAFATGVGPDNYQKNIGTYYDTLPNKKKMPPDSNNVYLVQAVSVGALGLGALLWMFGHFAGVALAARRRFPDDWLGAGVVAALTGCFFVSFFHAPLVRGTSLVLALLFALAAVAQLQGHEANAENEA